MPPKRRRAELTPDPTEVAATASTAALAPALASQQPSSLVSSSQDDTSPPPAKRTKTSEQIVDDEAPTSASQTASTSLSDVNEDEVDDGRPICKYDDTCYRRNAQHVQEFRHPKKRAKEIAARGGGSAASPPSTAQKPKPALKKRNSLSKTLSSDDINQVHSHFICFMIGHVVRIFLF